MKILVTGAGGQLGRAMVRVLGESHRVIGYDRRGWDVTDERRTREILLLEKPDAVIHCAAWTDVDGYETDPLKAYRINAQASRQLAAACGRMEIRMVYVSTDYVFDGTRQEGYVETDPADPINVYGRSKWLGEGWVRTLCPSHLILRTSWVFGRGGSGNFVTAILNRARAGMPLRVVDDQRGCPTYTVHLAEKTKELLSADASGVFHTAGSGDCTWFQFARAILRRAGLDAVSVTPIPSEELGRKARRPRVSVLRSIRLSNWGIAPLPRWEEGLEAYFCEGEEDGT